jgi:hypothetical protein
MDLLLSSLGHLVNEELEYDSVWRSVADGYVHKSSNGRGHGGNICRLADPQDTLLEEEASKIRVAETLMMSSDGSCSMVQ